MNEIQGTLELIRRRLDEFLSAEHPRSHEWVALSNIPGDRNDRLMMVLANVQRETATANAVVAPPLHIDLFILFYANFGDDQYAEGLGVIGRTIRFFQENPWFTRDNLPGLDPEIDKLTFEMVNLDLADLNYLLGMMGAKYLPSAYYKVRIILSGRR